MKIDQLLWEFDIAERRRSPGREKSWQAGQLIGKNIAAGQLSSDTKAAIDRARRTVGQGATDGAAPDLKSRLKAYKDQKASAKPSAGGSAFGNMAAQLGSRPSSSGSTQSDAGSKAFGNMASQLGGGSSGASTSSTGGTITRTGSGLTHRAKTPPPASSSTSAQQSTQTQPPAATSIPAGPSKLSRALSATKSGIKGVGDIFAQTAGGITQTLGAAAGGLKHGYTAAAGGKKFGGGGYAGEPAYPGTDARSDEVDQLKAVLRNLDSRMRNAGI